MLVRKKRLSLLMLVIMTRHSILVRVTRNSLVGAEGHSLLIERQTLQLV
jgi:hypothetical protein